MAPGPAHSPAQQGQLCSLPRAPPGPLLPPSSEGSRAELRQLGEGREVGGRQAHVSPAMPGKPVSALPEGSPCTSENPDSGNNDSTPFPNGTTRKGRGEAEEVERQNRTGTRGLTAQRPEPQSPRESETSTPRRRRTWRPAPSQSRAGPGTWNALAEGDSAHDPQVWLRQAASHGAWRSPPPGTQPATPRCWVTGHSLRRAGARESGWCLCVHSGQGRWAHLTGTAEEGESPGPHRTHTWGFMSL